MRFDISFSRLFSLLALMLGMRRHAYVELDGDIVSVKMGWAFSARVRRANIKAARLHRPIWYAIGVHALGRGDWVVNGTASHIVELRISPPVRARAIGLPVRLRRLRVSVDRPADLVAALSPPVVASS